PTNSFAHSYLGLSLAALGRHEEAVRECRKAIEIEPYDMTNFAELAGYLAALKRTDEAIAAMTRAVEIGFDDLDRMEKSAALAPLRPDARFQALVEEVKRRK
ncbi:MAG: tetratricopeptide repeat protein, partial [Planctomycetes bacterium]|nr:tetratricopeptide repeat protein [Planctomycetota bacterium]